MPLFPIFEDTVNFQTINEKSTSEYQTFFPRTTFSPFLAKSLEEQLHACVSFAF